MLNKEEGSEARNESRVEVRGMTRWGGGVEIKAEKEREGGWERGREKEGGRKGEGGRGRGQEGGIKGEKKREGEGEKGQEGWRGELPGNSTNPRALETLFSFFLFPFSPYLPILPKTTTQRKGPIRNLEDHRRWLKENSPPLYE